MTSERFVALVVGVLLAVACAATSRRSLRRLGSPVDVLPVFLGAWATVLVVFALPLIAYTPIPWKTWLLVYGSLASTTVGCLAAWRFAAPVERPVAEVGAREISTTVDRTRLRWMWAACFFIGLAGFMGFIWAVDQVIGWRSVFSDPQAVRLIKRDSPEFQSAYRPWTLLTYFNQLAFVLWTIGLRLKAFRGRWAPASIAGVLSIVPFAFTADRNLLAITFVCTVVLHLLWPRTGSWRRIGLGFVAAIVCATVMLAVIGDRYGGSLTEHPEIARHVTISGLDPVVIPYLYLTANLPTFSALTRDALAPKTYGQMEVLPLAKAASRFGLTPTSPTETGVFYRIPFEAFSNYSWLGSLWIDFRAPGVLLMTALLGFGASFSRLRLAARPSFLMLWTTAVLTYVIAYSPLSNVLSSSLTWQFLLAGPVIGVVIVRGTWRKILRFAHRHAAPVAVLAVGLVCVVGVVAATRAPNEPVDVRVVLGRAEKEARYVFDTEGSYPVPLGLATRLQAHDPSLRYQPQASFFDVVPPAGTIAVFTTPNDLFLRTRSLDGRIFEIHRAEGAQGVTFGPGTRDR